MKLTNLEISDIADIKLCSISELGNTRSLLFNEAYVLYGQRAAYELGRFYRDPADNLHSISCYFLEPDDFKRINIIDTMTYTLRTSRLAYEVYKISLLFKKVEAASELEALQTLTDYYTST